MTPRSSSSFCPAVSGINLGRRGPARLLEIITANKTAARKRSFASRRRNGFHFHNRFPHRRGHVVNFSSALRTAKTLCWPALSPVMPHRSVGRPGRVCVCINIDLRENISASPSELFFFFFNSLVAHFTMKIQLSDLSGSHKLKALGFGGQRSSSTTGREINTGCKAVCFLNSFFLSLSLCFISLSCIVSELSACGTMFHICINLQLIGVAKNQPSSFFFFFFTFFPSPLQALIVLTVAA